MSPFRIHMMGDEAKTLPYPEDMRVRFVPENYKAVYLNWMRNINDW